MTDYHRAAGCAFEDPNDLPSHSHDGKGADLFTWELKWLELLDWSVYHAPGYEEWQEFRKSLIGVEMHERWVRITEHWYASDNGLAETVRHVNLLRSLRGQFSTEPKFRVLLDQLNPRLKELWR